MRTRVLTHGFNFRGTSHITANVQDLKDRDPRIKQQGLQQTHLEHVCSLAKNFSRVSRGDLLRTRSSKRKATHIYRNPTNVTAQHTSSSTCSAVMQIHWGHQ